MAKVINLEGLSKFLVKIKELFSTKSETVSTIVADTNDASKLKVTLASGADADDVQMPNGTLTITQGSGETKTTLGTYNPINDGEINLPADVMPLAGNVTFYFGSESPDNMIGALNVNQGTDTSIIIPDVEYATNDEIDELFN